MRNCIPYKYIKSIEEKVSSILQRVEHLQSLVASPHLQQNPMSLQHSLLQLQSLQGLRISQYWRDFEFFENSILIQHNINLILQQFFNNFDYRNSEFDNPNNLIWTIHVFFYYIMKFISMLPWQRICHSWESVHSTDLCAAFYLVWSFCQTFQSAARLLDSCNEAGNTTEIRLDSAMNKRKKNLILCYIT